LLIVILNLIQNLLKNDPDFHQDDTKGIVILNLIQNLLKNDPDFHQDDDEKMILDPVPFDTGLEQARMTRAKNG